MIYARVDSQLHTLQNIYPKKISRPETRISPSAEEMNDE